MSARGAAATTDPLASAHAALLRQRPLPAALRAAAEQLRGGLHLLADMTLREHLAGRPDDADACCLAAQVSEQLRRPALAREQFERALALAPDFALARYRLAELLLRQEELADARRHLRLLCDQHAGQPLFLTRLAQVEERLGEGGEMLSLTGQLVALLPRHPATLVLRGHALRAMGEAAAAVQAYRQALALQPDMGQAWTALANLKTWRFEDADLEALQAALRRRSLPEAERPALQFALARGLEQRGAYAESFALYAEGNRAMRARIHYDAAGMQAVVDAQIALLDADFVARIAGQGAPGDEAIFIVGRPRSGSTLVEQMLASHAQVEGTSELPYVGHLARQLAPRAGSELHPDQVRALAGLEAGAWRALGQDYLRRAGAHRHSGRPRFIDKKPANVLHLALIHGMLPQAAIVDVRRHPAANAWSMYSAWGRGSMTLQEIGHYYRHYLRLVDHVQQLLPGRVLTLHYEQLVRQPEAELRRLLAHLGLPWEPACLDFHTTRRQVLTPSSEQVRRPIGTEAVDHWRHFEPWLGPLFEALGPAAA